MSLLSDEDFLKQVPSEEPETVVTETTEETKPDDVEDTQEVSTEEVTEPTGSEVNPLAGESVTNTDTEASAEDPVVEPETKEQESDYKSLVQAALAPLKAAGKVLEIQSIEELRTLAQMGVDYRRKTQSLASDRKYIMMLEQHGLLDEDKLSFLIDIEKKNPEAIKKLILDAGIDPLDIDTSAQPQYQVDHRHKITDSAVTFQDQLDMLKADPEGLNTLKTVHDSWDEQSKNALATEPQILATIHEHRVTGVYDRITQEVERLTVLGKIPQGTPFIQAYLQVGQLLSQQAAPEKPAPVAVKPATVKPQVTASQRAQAASPSMSNKAAVTKSSRVLSDEEFLKSFKPE